ncbi:Reverse transcriptase domain [Trinorchestia longiramus]|nr:Reverse transcriptase domain [Trinorchestia longiramus]
MNTNSLRQHVNKPTERNNIIDFIIATLGLSINGLEVTDKIGDHQIIDFTLKVQDNKNKFLTTNREKRSCFTNLSDFFGEVNRIYDRTKAAKLVYLDFQKAFDKVPHERLMTKVEAHGIRVNYSRRIRNGLTGRTQREINDRAARKLVETGVQRTQTTREELKDDLKASRIEASKHTISRALRREGLRSCTPRKTSSSPETSRQG